LGLHWSAVNVSVETVVPEPVAVAAATTVVAPPPVEVVEVAELKLGPIPVMPALIGVLTGPPVLDGFQLESVAGAQTWVLTTWIVRPVGLLPEHVLPGISCTAALTTQIQQVAGRNPMVAPA
jgi:hypothetical protein